METEHQSSALFQVQLGDAGCLMTRRELEAAFEREDIDPYTLVRLPGTMRWRSFGALNGIEAETIMLASTDVEIVSPGYQPSFVAPKPVAIDTKLPSAPLTKQELATARPRRGLAPAMLLVGVAALAGGVVVAADRWVPGAKPILSGAMNAVSAMRVRSAEAAHTPPPPPPASTHVAPPMPPASAIVAAMPESKPASPPPKAAPPVAPAPAKVVTTTKPAAPRAAKPATALAKTKTNTKAKPPTAARPTKKVDARTPKK